MLRFFSDVVVRSSTAPFRDLATKHPTVPNAFVPVLTYTKSYGIVGSAGSYRPAHDLLFQQPFAGELPVRRAYFVEGEPKCLVSLGTSFHWTPSLLSFDAHHVFCRPRDGHSVFRPDCRINEQAISLLSSLGGYHPESARLEMITGHNTKILPIGLESAKLCNANDQLAVDPPSEITLTRLDDAAHWPSAGLRFFLPSARYKLGDQTVVIGFPGKIQRRTFYSQYHDITCLPTA